MTTTIIKGTTYFANCGDCETIAETEAARERAPTKDDIRALKILLSDFRINTTIPKFATVIELEQWKKRTIADSLNAEVKPLKSIVIPAGITQEMMELVYKQWYRKELTTAQVKQWLGINKSTVEQIVKGKAIPVTATA